MTREKLLGMRDGISSRRHVLDANKEFASGEGHSADRSILVACHLAYGEKCDVRRSLEDTFGSRVNSYLIALNDWVDVGKKLEESPEKIMLKNVFERASKEVDQYFVEVVDDPAEEARRKKLKELFADVLSKVLFLEGKADTVEDGLEGYAQIKKYRELINAVETILNIQIYVNENLFDNRIKEDGGEPTVEKVSATYDWLTNPEYDGELTDEEENARMLYFASMSVQMANDRHRYKADRTYDIWKPMTYLTEKMGYTDKMAESIILAEEHEYQELAEKYGLSRRVSKFANMVGGKIIDLANWAVSKTHSKIAGEIIIRKMLDRHVYRQIVEAKYPKDHPDFEIN